MTNPVSGGFQFTPPDGMNNAASYPTVPANETAARQMWMDFYWQLMNEMNKPTLSAPAFAQYNKLINGNFDVWQKGTTFNNVNTNQYTADRLVISNGLDTNVRVLQSTTVPDAKSKYSLRVEQYGTTSGASAITDANQRIESYSYFGGQTITFSGKILVDTGVTCTPYIFDGSAFTAGPAIVGDGTWKTFKVTVTFASSISSLSVFIRMDRNGIAVGKGFNLSQVQVNAGDQALPFQPRSYGEELSLCWRYFRRLGRGIIGRWTGASTCEFGYSFGTQMRVGPTITLNKTNLIVNEIGVAGRTGSSSAISSVSSTVNGATFTLNGFSGATTGGTAAIADDAIDLDAEI